MNIEVSTQALPICPRIVAYTDASHGEDMWCTCAEERKALCPDCDSPVCVFCEEECDYCGAPMWG
jgi:hypothetical protein